MTFQHKKKLGQHFLKDANIARKIATSAQLGKGDSVWEIGPGEGILTDALLSYSPRLTVFEIDRRLYEKLLSEYGSCDNFKLVEKDFLKVNWQEYGSEKVSIVANLPYQITSPILFKLIENAERINRAILMMQKEVATRLQAAPGTKDYGQLTLKLGFYFKVKRLFNVPPHVFQPPPKVTSSVIQLIPREDKPEIDNPALYFQIIVAAFARRRKMLRGNLATILSAEEMQQLHTEFDLTKRGESLDEAAFLAIYRSVHSMRD